MKENGTYKLIKEKAEDFSFGRMAQFMKAFGETTKQMEKDA